MSKRKFRVKVTVQSLILLILFHLLSPSARSQIQFGDIPVTTDLPYSITVASGHLSLVNDVAAPGNNQCYSTNGSGILGWNACGGSASHSVTLYADGAGTLLVSGTQNPHKLLQNESGTLQGWVLIVKPSGSVTVDIYRAADGGGSPTTSIIGGGAKPAVSSAIENSSTSFSGWTSTTLSAKDNLAINLSGITNVTYVELRLYFQ